MDIQTVDPLAPAYNVLGYEKLKAFHKRDVEDANYLVRISHGKRETVETTSDWEIISKLFEFWTRRWPNEWQDYAKSIIDIKATRARKDGLSRTHEIKYVGALPPRFMRLIKAIFKLQQFDKKFVYGLTNRIKLMKVGQKHDAWFLI